MEPAVRLARSATIAGRLVEALARGAVPGDGSHDNRLAEGVAGFTQIDPAQFAATRRAILGGNRFREDLVNAAATWAEAIDQAFVEGHPLPPVLAASVDGVGPATLDPLAAQVYGRISTGLEAVPPAGRHPRRILLVAGTGALAVALVAWLIVRSLGPEASDLPFSAAGFSPACDGTVFPDAPAYHGGPPHPTVVFSTDYNVQLSGKWSTVQAIYNEENAFSAAWKASEPRTIQAAACIALDGEPQETVKQCPYSASGRPGPTQIPMYQGEFTITLYEVRTGKRIHQAHISGEVTTCPKMVPVGATHVFSSPSPQQYIDAIGQFVDG
jgi:hypothetical protein